MKVFFDYIFRLVVTVAAIWGCYVLSSEFLAPAPYELRVVNPKSYTVCPGDSFTYQSEVIVRKTPMSLLRTETWYSYQTKNNVIFDRYQNVEIFNWDKKVVDTISRSREVKVPELTSEGNLMVPGKYRYIVNLNSWGVQVPASMSLEVIIPENCS
jgi:hypothetical protein